MFSQMVGFEAESVDIPHNRQEQVTDGLAKLLVFDVEWVLPQVVVQIPY